MKTIWKFKLALQDRQEIPMPVKAKILSVQIQHGELCMWAEVNPSNLVAHRKFAIVGTGHTVPDQFTYIGTVQQGILVWHIFQLP